MALMISLVFGSVCISAIPIMAQEYFDTYHTADGTSDDYEYDYTADDYGSDGPPINDEKYECRTGPLEGIVVGSVEFCKFNKFDDKKDDRKDSRDNRTGTQGPPGATGATGPVGPQGPQGLTGPQGERGLTGTTGATGPASTVPGPQAPMGFNEINGVNGTQGPMGFNGTNGVNGTQGPPGPSQILSTQVYVLPSASNFTIGSSTAFCNLGDTVLSGGYIMPTAPGVDFEVRISQNTVNDNSWTVSTNGVAVQAIAFCFDNP